MTTQIQPASKRSISTPSPVEQFSSSTLLQLLDKDPGNTPSIDEEFAQWDVVICSLPLMTEDYSFARNWVNSAYQLWKSLDAKTAAWQLRQVARRLRLA